jgi:hypothetical protein
MSAAWLQALALSRARTLKALGEVLGSPGRFAAFLVVASVVGLFYTLLLPFEYTERLEVANWGYLDAYLLAWSVVLGLAMGLVVSVQVYSVRKVAQARAARSAAGGAVFVASLMPSLFCCTPVIPSLLAFVGVSGAGLYTTTGTLQHFFATHQTEFLAASLSLFVLMGWWGLRRVASAACTSDEGCVTSHKGGPLEAAGADEAVVCCGEPSRPETLRAGKGPLQ